MYITYKPNYIYIYIIIDCYLFYEQTSNPVCHSRLNLIFLTEKFYLNSLFSLVNRLIYIYIYIFIRNNAPSSNVMNDAGLVLWSDIILQNWTKGKYFILFRNVFVLIKNYLQMCSQLSHTGSQLTNIWCKTVREDRVLFYDVQLGIQYQVQNIKIKLHRSFNDQYVILWDSHREKAGGGLEKNIFPC